MVSSSRRAVARSAASSLTRRMVYSRGVMSSSISHRSSLVGSMGFLGGRSASAARKLVVQKAKDFLGQLLDAERFRNMGETVLREEIVGLLGDYVSGHKQEPFLKGIPRARQRLVEMLAVQSGHFHVADHQVEGLARRAIECFASV